MAPLGGGSGAGWHAQRVRQNLKENGLSNPDSIANEFDY